MEDNDRVAVYVSGRLLAYMTGRAARVFLRNTDKPERVRVKVVTRAKEES